MKIRMGVGHVGPSREGCPMMHVAWIVHFAGLIVIAGCSAGDSGRADVPNATGTQADVGGQVDSREQASQGRAGAPVGDAAVGGQLAPRAGSEDGGQFAPNLPESAGQAHSPATGGSSDIPMSAGQPSDEGQTSSGGQSPRTLEESGLDEDGDGLDDGWEASASDPARLSANRADTDGNGIMDGDEDFDGDGLTVRQEFDLGKMMTAMSPGRPHPFISDLLVEIDTRVETEVPPEALAIVQRAFAEAVGVDGVGEFGIRVHFFIDQVDLDVGEFDDRFEPKKQLLAATRGLRSDAWGEIEGMPAEHMLHVVVAGARRDKPTRGGETIGESAGSDGMARQARLNQTGILIFADSLAELFPGEGKCGAPADESYEAVPYVTYAEAFASTLLHELGHALQLGHDTDEGGGVNDWNVMSTPSGCPSLRRRIHGEGNFDPARGSTEAGFEPRFSDAAEALMEIGNKLGVDTASLADKTM
ncbi:MAG: hypothetical protein VX589_20485 [Myxococcota bacterium]|nr:hypothetical protein [Myxococcota bacterium]